MSDSEIDRVPKTTLDCWKAELSEWMVPGAFRSRVDAIIRPLPRHIFFRQGGLAFLRDAWIAGKVANALSSRLVRLVPHARPDFEVQKDREMSEQFEVTEADMDGRRRGDEIDLHALEPDPVENWQRRFEAIPAALNRVVAKKVSKDYPPGVSLVIYLNLGCYGAYTAEGLPIISESTSAARAKFRSVFVMWEGVLYKFWEGGKPATERWPIAQPDDF